MRRGLERDVELRTISVGASIGHREKATSIVTLIEALVCESLSVDGLTAGTVVVGEVTALSHEPGDDAVEG